MHSPLAPRSKIGAVGPSTGQRKWVLIAVALVIAVAGVAGYFERSTLHEWLFGPTVTPTILVSGNIEAHQSVLGFKTVLARFLPHEPNIRTLKSGRERM